MMSSPTCESWNAQDAERQHRHQRQPPSSVGQGQRQQREASALRGQKNSLCGCALLVGARAWCYSGRQGPENCRTCAYSKCTQTLCSRPRPSLPRPCSLYFYLYLHLRHRHRNSWSNLAIRWSPCCCCCYWMTMIHRWWRALIHRRWRALLLLTPMISIFLNLQIEYWEWWWWCHVFEFFVCLFI